MDASGIKRKIDEHKRKKRSRPRRRVKCESCGLYSHEAQSCSCGQFAWDQTEQRRINEHDAINRRTRNDSDIRD